MVEVIYRGPAGEILAPQSLAALRELQNNDDEYRNWLRSRYALLDPADREARELEEFEELKAKGPIYVYKPSNAHMGALRSTDYLSWKFLAARLGKSSVEESKAILGAPGDYMRGRDNMSVRKPSRGLLNLIIAASVQNPQTALNIFQHHFIKPHSDVAGTFLNLVPKDRRTAAMCVGAIVGREKSGDVWSAVKLTPMWLRQDPDFWASLREELERGGDRFATGGFYIKQDDPLKPPYLEKSRPSDNFDIMRPDILLGMGLSSIAREVPVPEEP